MHQADIRGAVGGRAAVKIDALQERAKTIAHSNDGDSDFVHLQETSETSCSYASGARKLSQYCHIYGAQCQTQGWPN
jgi:hypothetical protein